MKFLADLPQRDAFFRRAGRAVPDAPVVIELGKRNPTFAALTLNEGLSGLALCIQSRDRARLSWALLLWSYAPTFHLASVCRLRPPAVVSDIW